MEKRINEKINVKEVILIDQNGINVGKVPTFKALGLAKSYGLDLVEFASPAGTICKIMDYKKMMFDMSKNEKRSKTPHEIIKEIRVGMTIAQHDLEVKNSKVNEFLNKGFKVKYSVTAKGFRTDSSDVVAEFLKKAIEEFKGKALVGEVKVSDLEAHVMIQPLRGNKNG